LKIKEKKYLKDKIANIIFTDESCKEYVESVVSAALNIPLEIVKDNLILKTNRINNNLSTKYSYVDAIYENNTSIINIEINYNNTKSLRNKNMRYVCQLLLKGLNNKEIKPIYQININNFDIFKDNEFLSRSYIIKEGTEKIRDKSICIIDINLAFLQELNYNKIKEEPNSLEYLLYFFVNDDKKELDKLYLEDEIMEKVQEKLYTLDEALDAKLYYDLEELKKAEIEELKDLGREEGRKEGHKEGLKEGENKKAQEIAKNLLKLNIPIEDILIATKLSKEEIESLKAE